MFPLKTILLPTDYSIASEHALSLAHHLALTQGARLIGLHVIQPPDYCGQFNLPETPPPFFHDNLYQWLKKGCGHDENHSVESRVVEGFAWEEIVRAAGESHCDLIVMASEGKTGIGRALLGSVAEQVVRRSPCPVLICKAPVELTCEATTGSGGQPLFSTVLFPTDLSDGAGEAFPVATALAGPSSRLIVEHVIGEPGPAGRKSREELTERLHGLYPADPGACIVYRQATGNPVEEIRRAAEDSHCDLIVMSSHGRTGLKRLLMGSVAEQVFRTVRVPVVIVRTASPEPVSEP